MNDEALVLCEVSGVWSEALCRRGYSVLQVDLGFADLPRGERRVVPGYDGRWVQLCEDVCSLDLADRGRFKAVAAFPPCTDLAGSGAAYWARKAGDGRIWQAVHVLTRCALWCASATVGGLLENPRGLASRVLGRDHLEVDPWEFAQGRREEFSKRTCIWLYGGWPVPFSTWAGYGGKLRSWVRHVGGTETGWQAKRSLSWPGMAKAFVGVLPAGNGAL